MAKTKRRLTARETLDRRIKKWGEAFDPEIKTKLFTQAEWIIYKFGGARNLSRALALCGYHRDPSVIFRWTYPKGPTGLAKGSGGLVPTSARAEIQDCARRAGVLLEDSDWRNEPTKREYFDIPKPKYVRKKREKKAI